MLDGHISTCLNKDTRDLFMLCIMLVCQLHRVSFTIVVNFFLLLFASHLSFVRLCLTFFSFDSFAFHCSLFIVQKKIFNSDPVLHSRYFDPLVSEVPVHHHLCKSNVLV
jgi:hypothetical protein